MVYKCLIKIFASQMSIESRTKDLQMYERTKTPTINKNLSLWLDIIPATLVMYTRTDLQLAFIKGTHGDLVARVAEIYKHYNPGLLLRCRQVLFVNPIRQSHCRNKNHTLEREQTRCICEALPSRGLLGTV